MAIPYYGNGKILASPFHQIYEQLYSGFAAHKSEITIAGKHNSDDIYRIVEFVLDDYPEFFFIGKKSSFIQSENSITIQPRYRYSPADAANIQTQIDRKVSSILRSAFRTDADTLGKAKAIYAFLVQNVKYCPDFDINSNDHSSFDHTNHSMVGPLINGKSVCEGYARAFKYLCDAIKLPCVVVNGPAKSPLGGEGPHAWNIVKLKGAFYHIDATWDSVHGDVNHSDYFCISDEDAGKDHSWDRSLMPLCSTTLFPVPYVKGKKEFEQFVHTNVSQGTMSFSVRFDNQFANISEKSIPNMVASFLEKKPPVALRARGFTVEVRWNETQRKAVIKIC